MPAISRLHFDSSLHDFVINGQPLLAHLAKHEGINKSNYQPSLGVQPCAKERLLSEAEPDLPDGHVALYVCGMCGDYDGSPLGVRVVATNPNVVSWEEFGWYDEIDGWREFAKVRGYCFDRTEYFAALHKVFAT